jgi:hypothetical protein
MNEPHGASACLRRAEGGFRPDAGTNIESTADDPSAGCVRRPQPTQQTVQCRHWNLLAANRLVPLLLLGVDESLLQAPVNVLRLTLHPMGLAPRIINLAQWRAHLLDRLGHQVAATADPALSAPHRDAQLHQHDHDIRFVSRRGAAGAGARDLLPSGLAYEACVGGIGGWAHRQCPLIGHMRTMSFSERYWRRYGYPPRVEIPRRRVAPQA